VSATTIIEEGLDEALNAISSNFSICFFSTGRMRMERKMI